jgi:hypothetical protein
MSTGTGWAFVKVAVEGEDSVIVDMTAIAAAILRGVGDLEIHLKSGVKLTVKGANAVVLWTALEAVSVGTIQEN